MSAPATNPDDLLTMEEVAVVIGVEPATVSRYRQRGILPKEDAMFGRTPVWARHNIERWDAEREKRPKVRKAARS
ncbi:helix-turn-helix DNA binding protein [Microbacterium phage Megan]|uniref:Helix-turn-helix DNA binding protein n=1 Tax=Microbacterium phage Megan TaxID=2656551 RepID=A0A649VM10_9CAUD|nr:helix-turn-helix DNA binding protein [Microbacterium phage Megan]QGJ92733.1 helix-turn-helix DNA binding protein [Microbacterium phage Megan]